MTDRPRGTAGTLPQETEMAENPVAQAASKLASALTGGKPASPKAGVSPPAAGNGATAAPKPKTEITMVKMDDGTLVEFPGKRRLIKTTTIKDGTVKVRLDWRNGESRTFAVPPAMLPQFAGHGAEQKLGDESSGVEDIEDAIEVTDTLIERLTKGEWSVKREPGEGAGASILVRALVEKTGKSKDTVRAFLATKNAKQKYDMRNSEDLQPIIRRLEAERAAKGPKTDVKATLSELAAM